MDENPMRQIRIEKVTLNIGCGPDQQKVEKAKKLLEYLTKEKAIITPSRKRSTFGVAKGKPLGAAITLRKQKAIDFLKKAFAAVDNKIKSSQLDKYGNFSIGIKEYIDLPGVKYQHDIGMLGADVAVTLERPGYRIKRRKIQNRKIPKKHKINKEEVKEWLRKSFGVEVVE